MELKRLLYFARIAQDGSLTRAAGVLRIAQPALSRQMRLLEEELGVRLFERTARGMRLTAEGEYLRTATAGPLRGIELAMQTVRSLSSGMSGHFTIGMPPGIGEVLAGPLALKMAADFPDIRLRIVEGPTGSLIEWTNRAIIDFALLEGGSQDDRLTDVALHEAPLMLASTAGSGIDPGRAIPFAEALTLPLILSSHHMGLRAVVSEAAARMRVTLAPRMEADAPALIRTLVEGGMGHALLPRLYMAEALRAGRLVACRVVDPALTLPIMLAFRKADRANGGRAQEVLVDMIRACLAEYVQ